MSENGSGNTNYRKTSIDNAMNKLTINQEHYQRLVSSICRDITLSDWRPDYVVGLTRGGLLPAVMISHYFDVPMHTLKVSLRDMSDTESNLWMAEDAFGYVSKEDREAETVWSDAAKRKKILIVDDINDTGATLNWIMDDWQSGCLPAAQKIWDSIWNDNVRFATVVDNLSSRCRVKMDYTGMTINKAEQDVWVDFPYEEWWTK